MSRVATIGVVGLVAIGGVAAALAVMNANQHGRQNGLFATACTVTTKGDISSAFGWSYKNGVPEKGTVGDAKATATTCRYTPSTTKVAELAKATNVTVNLQTYPNDASAKTAFQATKSQDKAEDKAVFVATDIASLGDEAFQLRGKTEILAHTEENIYVRSGRQIIQLLAVNLGGIDHDKSKTAMITLIKRALQ